MISLYDKRERLFLIIFFSIFFNSDFVFGEVTIQGANFTSDRSNLFFENQISLENITVQSDGISMKFNDMSDERKYTFYRQTSIEPYNVNFTGFSDTSANFTVNTVGLTDTKLNVSGSQISSVFLDNILTSDIVWNGFINTINTSVAQFIAIFFSATVTNPQPNSTSANGGSNGDQTPPSFTMTFSETEFPFSINNHNYRLDQLNNLSDTTIETGKPIKLQILVYENEGAQNIQHVTLYVNQQGEKILNDLTETSITFEKGDDLKIIDPYNLIQYASITASTLGNKVVFEFELIFANQMDTSDLLFRIWDVKRNSVDLYIPKSLTVIHAEPTSEIMKSDILQESDTETNTMVTEEPIFSWEIFNQWAGFSETSISDEEFLNHLGIDGKNIPKWIKQNNAKWIKEEKISQQDLMIALKNLKNRGII